MSINKEATIRWKGYNPDDLSEKSTKRVWANCEECGHGRWIYRFAYHDLCKSCAGKKRTGMKGEKNGMYGKKHSEATIEKMKVAAKGKYTGMKNPMYGSDRSGENGPMYGKKHTEETKLLMSRNHTDVSGVNNPMYGTYRTGDDNPFTYTDQSGENNGMFGKNHTIESRIKSSAALQGITINEWRRFSINNWRDWSKAIYLNEPFTGCHRHHITETIVVCIPAELHDHIRHNLKTGHNMGEINMVALQYINGGL